MLDPKKKLTKAVKLETYKWEVPLNSRNQVNLNPLVFKEFKKVSPKACTKVAAYFLDDDETVLGLFWDDEDPDGLKVHPSKSDGTATIALGLLVRKYPALKVEKGRERPFPAKLTTHEGAPALVLNVTYIDSVPKTSRRKPSAGAQPNAKTPPAPNKESAATSQSKEDPPTATPS